jgi:hypothetical protein
MGIGAAWNQEESAAYGVPFRSTKERFPYVDTRKSLAHLVLNLDFAL